MPNNTLPETIIHERSHRFDVTLAGETNLDLVLYGLPETMPMERELLANGFAVTLGGSSSILAHNLARLGSRVGFTTEIGGDSLGKIALGFLEEAGVDLSKVRRKDHATTGITVLLPHGAHRHILTYPGLMNELAVTDLDFGYLSSTRHFHLSSLFLQTGLHPGLPKFLGRLRGQGIMVSLDTNDDPSGTWAGILDAVLDHVDILLPNENELLKIAHRTTLQDSLDLLSTRVPTIVVKCGGRGALLQHGTSRTSVSAPAVSPVETIGAGDSFNAGFLHALSHGSSLEEAVKFGCRTGALSTLRSGGVQSFCEPELMNSVLGTY